MAATNNTSAGLLLCRRVPMFEFLLVHPGGPYFSNKDLGAWTIPKGLIEPGEQPLATALREFVEETGFSLPSSDPTTYLPLGEIKQKGGKRVIAWAAIGDADASAVCSNLFELEWPPRSGRRVRYPEVDRAGWFDFEGACTKINPAQVPLLERAIAQLERTSG